MEGKQELRTRVQAAYETLRQFAGRYITVADREYDARFAYDYWYFMVSTRELLHKPTKPVGEDPNEKVIYHYAGKEFAICRRSGLAETPKHHLPHDCIKFESVEAAVAYIKMTEGNDGC